MLDINSNKKFEIILAINILYYIKDIKKYILKLHKLLKKGGYLIILGPKQKTTPKDVAKVLEKDFKNLKKTSKNKRILYNMIESNYQLLKYYKIHNEIEIKKILKENGFTLIEDKKSCGNVNYLWLWQKKK